jgi:hypothetical protein
VLADLSVNYVERFALRCGFAVQRLSPDYGLDLAIFTFDESGFLENGVVWMQLKATDHVKESRDGKNVLVRIERRDILAWLGQVNPVVLVVFDAVRELAYHLTIQDYFAGNRVFTRLRGSTVTVPIPVKNLMSEAAM